MIVDINRDLLEEFIIRALKSHMLMETKSPKAQQLSKSIIINLQDALIYLERLTEIKFQAPATPPAGE